MRGGEREGRRVRGGGGERGGWERVYYESVM